MKATARKMQDDSGDIFYRVRKGKKWFDVSWSEVEEDPKRILGKLKADFDSEWNGRVGQWVE